MGSRQTGAGAAVGLGIAALFAVALGGCGTPVCVMGVGSCQQMYANAPPLNGSGLLNNNNNLVINGPQGAIGVNQRYKFSATGGTPSPVSANLPTGYLWSFVPPGSNGPTTSTSTAAIAADGTFVSTAPGQFHIQVNDNASQSATFLVTVQ